VKPQTIDALRPQLRAQDEQRSVRHLPGHALQGTRGRL
jgi:hypothetical protein